MTETKKEYIKKKLIEIHSTIEIDKKFNLQDVNIKAEEIFRRVLNATYSWNLIDANKKIKNFPAIDLIDESEKIVLQVTSSLGTAKINDTLRGFKKFKDDIELKKYANYRLIFCYILKEKEVRSDKFLKDRSLKNDDFIDITDILEKVDEKTENSVYQVLKNIYVEKNPLKNTEINIDGGLTGAGSMSGGIFNQTVNYYVNEDTLINTREKAKIAEDLLFNSIKKSKPIYIKRKIDNDIKDIINQKKNYILFISAQGGMGKSTLLKEIPKQFETPSIIININTMINTNISMIDILLDRNNTPTKHCPKFELKRDELLKNKDDRAECFLISALKEDFKNYGVFIIDTFEKNKNFNVESRVNFIENGWLEASGKTPIRFRDYIESLIYRFLEHTTFIIAGRNRLVDVNTDKNETSYLFDFKEKIQELSINKFELSDIKEFFKKFTFKDEVISVPSEKQLNLIDELTKGNPLLVNSLSSMAKEYSSWDGLDYKEMKKRVLEDEEYGLLYYFTKSIISHIDNSNELWKLAIPRVLTKEVEKVLFEENDILNLLVDKGLASIGNDNKINKYLLHDEVLLAIKANARKELKGDFLSWHDNEKVRKIHSKLEEFYTKKKLVDEEVNFYACYHKMMIRKDFEFDMEKEEFVQSFLGSLFIGYDEKVNTCKIFIDLDKKDILEKIKKIRDEVKYILPRMSKKLYTDCSSYVEQGYKDGIYNIEFLNFLLTKYNEDKDKLNIYSFLSKAYLNNKKYSQAIEVYVKSLKIDDKDDWYYLLIGNAYFLQNDYNNALINYKTAVNFNSQRLEAYNNMGTIYTYSKKYNYSKAIECYDNSLKIKPSANIYIDRGIVSFQLKEYGKAIEFYHKAIKLNPYNERIYIELGNLYRDKKKPNYQKALDFYREAIEVNPNNEEIYNHMGIVYFRKKEYQKAVDYHTQAIKINSNKEIFYINMGDSYRKLNENIKAFNFYKKALKFDSKDSYLYNEMGTVLYQRKQYDDAIRFYKSSLEIDNSDFIVYNNLGNAYKANKEYSKAIDSFAKSLKIKKDKNFSAQYEGASVYVLMKKYEQAIQIYKQLLPSYPHLYRKMIVYDGLSKCYFREGKYILMLKAMKEKIILKKRLDNIHKYRRKEEFIKKIISWKEKMYISEEEDIYKVLIAFFSVGCFGLIYILM